MFVDDVLQAKFFGKFGGILFQFNFDACAAFGHLRRADIVTIFACCMPGHGFGIQPMRTGRDPHPFRHHEDGIKSNAELTDDLPRICLMFLRQFKELARARLRDGAKVFNNVVACHADACVLDGQQAILFIHCDADLQFCLRVEHVLIGQHLEAQTVERIRRV